MNTTHQQSNNTKKASGAPYDKNQKSAGGRDEKNASSSQSDKSKSRQ